MTRTVALDISCFCRPSFTKLAVTTSDTSPAGTLLSICAMSNVAISIGLPSSVVMCVVTAGNSAVDSGVLSFALPSNA